MEGGRGSNIKGIGNPFDIKLFSITAENEFSLVYDFIFHANVLQRTDKNRQDKPTMIGGPTPQ